MTMYMDRKLLFNYIKAEKPFEKVYRLPENTRENAREDWREHQIEDYKRTQERTLRKHSLHYRAHPCP